MAKQEIKLNKQVFGKISYPKIIDTEFYNALIPFEDGVRLSVASATSQSANSKILSARDWRKPKEKRHQNVLAFIKIAERLSLP